MYKLTSVFLVASSLLLISSCNTTLTPTQENMDEPHTGKRKRTEEKDNDQTTSYKRNRTDIDSGLPVTIAQKASKKLTEELIEKDISTLSVIDLPDEIMLQVFSELSVKDIARVSQVCRHWQALSEEPALWRVICLQIHGDYPVSNATREQAKKHVLRVYINTLSDHSTITQLVHKHNLNEGLPFRMYQDYLLDNLYVQAIEMLDDYAAQGNRKAICRKEETIRDEIQALLYGWDDCEPNPTAAVALNDALVEQGNEEAIKRKVDGLTYGRYGYKEDQKAAVIFINSLVGQGSEAAIAIKIEGLAECKYGYEHNPQAAFAINEALVEQGNQAAIARKILGLGHGQYGYEHNPQAAVAINEALVEQDNQAAIERKIVGLIVGGNYGYERNTKAAVIFTDSLVGPDNPTAIRDKLMEIFHDDTDYGHNKGGELEEAFQLINTLFKRDDEAEYKIYEYETDPKNAVILNNSLVAQGNEQAIWRKIDGLLHGNFGYEKNLAAAVRFNDSLAAQGNHKAIKRKIQGLLSGREEEAYENGGFAGIIYGYGYKKDLIQLKSWIEEEAAKGKRWACYLKAQGLKYGILGFKKDRQAAIEYILKNNIPY